MTIESNKKKRKKAGHRSWAPQNAPVKGKHNGDIMSREKRSALMSKIRGKNTRPEITLFRMLKERRIEFSTHVSDLPGKPDVVLENERLAIFVDGDFWHGWRFPLWKHKLSKEWQNKIASTRARDKKNFRRLRSRGWRVIRIWEHQIESDAGQCIDRIIRIIWQDIGKYPFMIR